jgi:uncharacterized protein (DUF58 family)
MPVTEAQAIRLTQQGDILSSSLPPLLVQAEKVAASVILGIHGRKAAGPGESFWQYRPYAFGDSTQRIDWHRSARADGVFIRENEWESANTLWVWANTSARMDYKSHLSNVTKRERAQLIAMAMACLAVRGHERVGALGSLRHASHGRVSLTRVSEQLSQANENPMPKPKGMQRRAAAVIVSDFLDTAAELKSAMTAVASAGIRGHLVQIADPAEESLPFDGRIEFKGIDLPATYLARKTEDLRSDYVKAYAAHRSMLRDLARSLGFSFTVHRTDQTPAQILLPLHLQISGRAMAPQAAGAAR